MCGERLGAETDQCRVGKPVRPGQSRRAVEGRGEFRLGQAIAQEGRDVPQNFHGDRVGAPHRCHLDVRLDAPGGVEDAGGIAQVQPRLAIEDQLHVAVTGAVQIDTDRIPGLDHLCEQRTGLANQPARGGGATVVDFRAIQQRGEPDRFERQCPVDGGGDEHCLWRGAEIFAGQRP